MSIFTIFILNIFTGMIEIRHAKWECKKVIENQSLRDHLRMYIKDKSTVPYGIFFVNVFFQQYKKENIGE